MSSVVLVVHTITGKQIPRVEGKHDEQLILSLVTEGRQWLLLDHSMVILINFVTHIEPDIIN